MADVYIIGHKNPDTDSIASAVAYSRLKNKIDPENTYIPARCGNANNQTKYIFQYNDEKLPVLIRDFYPKVSGIMTTDVYSIKTHDSILDALQLQSRVQVSALPVVDKDNHLQGIVGVPQLFRQFVQDRITERPKYLFNAENIASVLNGTIVYKGGANEFEAAILIGAMQQESYKSKIDSINAEDVLLIVGGRKDLIQYAVERQVAAIIITGDNSLNDVDFTGYNGWIITTSVDTAEAARTVVLASPVHSIMQTSVDTFKKSDYIESIKERLLQSELRVVPVVDDNGILVGIITRTNILKKPKPKIILMDHNEFDQAVDGIEYCTIAEIVDHHRLGTIKTIEPVTFYAKPVGSTCTLVFQLYKSFNITLDKSTAMLLAGGILSDTVMLKSPTATIDDRTALKELHMITGVDPEKYGIEIFGATDSLRMKSAADIVNTDYKKYSEHGFSFGISQIEVVTLNEVELLKDTLLTELDKQRSQNGLHWTLLMITDIINGNSILLTTDFPPGEKLLSYRKLSDHMFSLPGILSRKKQLLPEILRVMEELK